MSALRIEKRTSYSPDGKVAVGWCSFNENHQHTPRQANWKATVLGYPAGLMCTGCALMLRKIWEEALDEPPIQNKPATGEKSV